MQRLRIAVAPRVDAPVLSAAALALVAVLLLLAAGLIGPPSATASGESSSLAAPTVTEIKDSTFYATLTLNKDGAEIDIDSRPSDALALAVRTDAPIFAATALVDENAIEFEREVDDTEEIVESFRDFLESVSPEDFATAEATPDDVAFAIDQEVDDEDEDEEDEDEEDEDDDDVEDDKGEDDKGSKRRGHN